MSSNLKTLIPMAGLALATGGAGLAAAPAAAGAAASGAAAGGSIFSASNIALASAGLSVLGSVGQGLAQSQAASVREAEANLRRAAEATQNASENLARERRLRSVLQAQRAAFGAAGISTGSGSALQIASQSISDAAQAASAANRASGIRQSVFGLNARSARRAGKFNLVSGLVEGGATIGAQFALNQQGDE